VLGTLAIWAHGQLTGQPLGTLWDVVVLAIVIAGGIAVFGKDTFGSAIDEAQDVQGSDTDSEE